MDEGNINVLLQATAGLGLRRRRHATRVAVDGHLLALHLEVLDSQLQGLEHGLASGGGTEGLTVSAVIGHSDEPVADRDLQRDGGGGRPAGSRSGSSSNSSRRWDRVVR